MVNIILQAAALGHAWNWEDSFPFMYFSLPSKILINKCCGPELSYAFMQIWKIGLPYCMDTRLFETERTGKLCKTKWWRK